MTYQAIARKWRPKRFDEVVGQRGVTRTLRNMIAGGRIAQAFVFAGPRGVGKTTTARILARALNCEQGPAADPCGMCAACLEIGEGRDIDVLEIDAATHSQVDNVRDVIIAGLAIQPVRDRYKIFIIDEVHQLSNHSFNALLKSVEEPPPHVVFMMATTELNKIPDTILSRAQVFEFKTIGTAAIAEQLRKIADAEQIEVDEAAIGAIARFADGSMRDGESAFDQVIAFAGGAITTADVSATLGLVGRDLLLDIVQAVADEHAAALFDLAGRAVEAGYDLRQVCRELSKVVRDLLVLGIDPARLDDPDIVHPGEAERLTALAGRYSREDLMRAFDVLSTAEVEIRTSPQPRYHLEMALLRWVQLRKLVPLTALIEQLKGQGTSAPVRAQGAGADVARPAARGSLSGMAQSAANRVAEAARRAPAPGPPPSVSQRPAPAPPVRVAPAKAAAPPAKATEPAPQPSSNTPAGGDLKEALLQYVRTNKKLLYNTVIAQAQKIDVEGDLVIFTFGPAHLWGLGQLEQNRAWLESAATTLAGRRVTVTVAQSQAAGPPPATEAAAMGASAEEERKTRLKAEAMSDAGVQALFDVFQQAEIDKVEEM